MRIVRSVQINPDSVDLAYMDDADVRVEGSVYLTHHLSVSRGSNYDDEIDELEAAADALVTDVLVDWASSPPYEIPTLFDEPGNDDDEDDDDD